MTQAPPPGNRTPLGLLLYLEKFSLCGGAPGAPSGPAHPPLSTPRRALRGGVPRPLGPHAPGTTATLETSFAARRSTGRSAGPRSPTLKHPSAGLKRWRPAATRTARPWDLCCTLTLESTRRAAAPGPPSPRSLSLGFGVGRPLPGPGLRPPLVDCCTCKKSSLTSGRRRGATCRPRRSRTKGWIEG